MLLPTYSEESVIKPRDSAILNDQLCALNQGKKEL